MRKTLAPVLAIFLIVGVAFAIYKSLQKRQLPPVEEVREPQTKTLEPIHISVVAALPVEPWVSSTMEIYNNEEHFVDGRRVIVEVIPSDGLTALNKWARGEFNPIPTAWLAESRVWVNQANAAALDRAGRDIFLAGGRYRTQPIVLSPLVWGVWQDAYKTLALHFKTEELSWDEFHEAAVADSWQSLGGLESWGTFKLVVAHPKRDPAGLTAMVGAAGEYFDKPVVTTTDLQHPDFLNWLAEQFDTVVDFSPFGVENMLLFGRSNGDVGQIVESYLLTNMAGLTSRWKQPLQIIYPDPIAWFDFPFAIYMGNETSANEKQAALDFKNYLLTTNQQIRALDFGLRPTCVQCPTKGGLIARWAKLGVLETVPSASRMRQASRKGLAALTKWYSEKYEE